jgi:23S rRNA G2445 N2-methylase RlmL
LAQLRASSKEPPDASHKLMALGSDIDEKALDAARENARRLGVTSRVSWVHADFEAALSQVPRGAMVLTNPPYGKRVGRHDNLHDLYRRFEKVLRARPDLRPVVMACGLPKARLDLPWKRITRIENGGLKVTLMRLER